MKDLPAQTYCHVSKGYFCKSARESIYSVSYNNFFGWRNQCQRFDFFVLILSSNNNYVEVFVAVYFPFRLSSGLSVVIVWLFSLSLPALRSRSGRSIINGNWAIDRPGKYEGGGTMFTYRRPNEIRSTAGESFLAEGPTNEILDVYVSNKSTPTSRN